MAEKAEDLSLPASVVARIIKDALPDGVNVSKEARAAIGKAASVFILYSTACSNNFALKGKRKTLTAGDVFAALEDMEFQHFIPELKECLEAYKLDQKERKDAAADRRRKQQGAGLGTMDNVSTSVPVPVTTSLAAGSPLSVDLLNPLGTLISERLPSEEFMDLDPSLDIPPTHPLQLV